MRRRGMCPTVLTGNVDGNSGRCQPVSPLQGKLNSSERPNPMSMDDLRAGSLCCWLTVQRVLDGMTGIPPFEDCHGCPGERIARAVIPLPPVSEVVMSDPGSIFAKWSMSVCLSPSAMKRVARSGSRGSKRGQPAAACARGRRMPVDAGCLWMPGARGCRNGSDGIAPAADRPGYGCACGHLRAVE